MRRKGRPKKQKSGKNAGRRPGRPRKRVNIYNEDTPRPSVSKKAQRDPEETVAVVPKKEKGVVSTTVLVVDDGMSEGLHMTTSQVHALGALVACRECGESVRIGVRPTTKGMISEFTVACNVCEDTKSTNTPNLVRERKRKREKKDAVLQKTENINYAHVAAFLDNGLGYSGLRHYCKYFNARCLNEATFIVYARQVISDVVADTEESLQYSASIVREVFKSQLETDGLVDLTVAFTTTYHQWGSDFCLVAGAVIELTTGLVMDYDVANMYCHVCKINAKKIVSMSPAEMTEWFNKHQDTCEIREWCDELDHDAEEGVREIEPKYLECFIAKKIWSRSIDKFGFRYTTLIHESDEKIHEELSRAGVYGDVPILIDSATSCFSRRKSEHARTSFQTKLKAKCPRERVQTKDRIMYVYSMSIPEYNKFAISSNIKLRQLVKEMEGGEVEETPALMQEDGEERMPNALQMHEVKAIKRLVANGEEDEEEEEEEEVESAEREIMLEEEEVNREEQEVDDPEELEEEEGMEQGEDDEELLEEEEVLAAQNAEEEERRKLEAEWGEEEEEEEEEEDMQQQMEEEEEGDVEKQIEEMHFPLQIKEESKAHIKEEVLGLEHQLGEEGEEEEEGQQLEEDNEDVEVEQVDEDEEEEEDEEDEELEQLRLEDEDQQMEENEEEEEEEELQVEEADMIQEEEEEEAPQSTTKAVKEEDKPKTQEINKPAPANQGAKMGELRHFRREEGARSQQEDTSKKRKQEEEEQENVAKRSKQDVAKATQEDAKQGESKQKDGEKDRKEEKQPEAKEARSKELNLEDKKRQREDQVKEKGEKQKTDNQQAAKREEKQKVDIRQKEKGEEKQRTDTKASENKAPRPSDKREDRPKPDSKPGEKREEKSVAEKKPTEPKPREREDAGKERDATNQKEEENKASVEVKQKANTSQQQQQQPGKREGGSEGKVAAAAAGGGSEAADTRPKVTANATATERA